MVSYFSVNRRNYGHWDIYDKERRIFCIRGGPGSYFVRDERKGPENAGSKNFKTVSACLAYITDIFMFELIVAEGQDFEIIEQWNIRK